MSLRFALAGDDHSRMQVHSRLVRSEHGRFEAIETVVNQSRSTNPTTPIDGDPPPNKISGARVLMMARNLFEYHPVTGYRFIPLY